MRRAALLQSAKGKGKSSAWLKRHVNDPFVQNAKKDNLRSRSAFKLEEILQKHRIIQPHYRVVDLGAAPGGWSLSAVKALRGTGRLIAIDLLPMESIDNCEFIQGDFLSQEVREELVRKLSSSSSGRVDCVLSDMLHNMTGHKQTDHFRSMNLVYSVFDFAKEHLQRSQNSSMLVKLLRGEDESEFLADLRDEFDSVKVIKPAASRKDSAEMYVLARGKK